VRQPDGRFGLVDVLPAGAAGTELVEPVIIRLEVDFDIFRLGQHRDGRDRGMNASLGFRLGNALHAVRSPLVAQLAIDGFPLKAERDLA
jgi:hypothetical protein